ncbi:MAG: hypothetical protein JNK78_06190 [Planctomycetes bacterium]|nr:hypothetical protein [Planctomycetota bacterium]
MNTLSSLFAAVLAALPLVSQDPAAAPAADPLPAAGSPEAATLVDKAIEKMLAVGRGNWRSHEEQDNAMMRQFQAQMGGGDGVDVEGGWSQGMVWGETDLNTFVKHAGRMVVKTAGVWKLRATKLASGQPAPFALDPSLFFAVLRDLPTEERRVVHTDSAEVGGKKLVVLTMSFDGDVATDFVDSGAVPEVSGGMGAIVMGGIGGMGVPTAQRSVHVALFVDPVNGDVLRLGVKLYEKNPMFGNMRIQVQGAGGGDDDAEQDEAEEKAEKDDKGGAAKPEWKNGLPTRKPGRDESTMTYRCDFTKIGLVDAPDLGDKAKALLQIR